MDLELLMRTHKMQHVEVPDDSGSEPSIIIPASMLAGFTGSDTLIQRSSSHLIELSKRLLVVAEQGDTDEVRQLMARGSPFTTDWLGTSPLHAAAANGHFETCEVLIRAGISRDARTKVDRTALHIAAQEGHTDIVELLLAAGADVNAKDMLRMTPLHWAVSKEHVECVRLLLHHGANPHFVSKFDKTAFSMALEANRHDILEILEASISEAAEAATLEATDSLALVLEQVPVPAHQEEVQTSAPKVSPENTNDLKPFLENPLNVSSEQTAEETKLPEVKVEETVIDSNSQNTLRLLQAHGITMLPTDEQTLVASAVQSGQRVVLTEAGKLALNLTRTGKSEPMSSQTGLLQGGKKFITIRKTTPVTHQDLFKCTPVKQSQPVDVCISNQQVRAQAQPPFAFCPRRGRPPSSATSVNNAPNILKRATPAVVPSVSTSVGVAVVTPTMVTGSGGPPAKVFLKSTSPSKAAVKVSPTESQLADIATITRQLEEARREANTYKLLLSKKEREAELYRKQLQSITQQSH